MKRDVLYSVRGPKTLPEMTWEEVAEELQRTDLAILAVGSTEEHGPHMPLSADTIQGTEVSRRVAAALGSEGIHAVPGPPIPFGVSLELMDFPGTVTLSPATMHAVIKEVCTSLIKHGFRKLVLVMAHDGNLGVCCTAAQELTQQPGVRVLVVNWLPLVKQHNHEISRSTGVEGHGGEGETARVLACHPELVLIERARAFHPEAQEKLEADQPVTMGGGVFDPPYGMRQRTPVGSIGNPSVATVETGEKLYDLIVDWTCKVIKKHFGLKS